MIGLKFCSADWWLWLAYRHISQPFFFLFESSDPVFIPVPDNSANKRRKEIVPLQTIRTMSVHRYMRSVWA
ncbi:hypothetical protein S83_043034 [Arachis hypogaea]